MGQSMNKSMIANELADRHDLPKTVVMEFLNHFARLAYREARHVFPIPGLGKLRVVTRRARLARHPRTGATMTLPARRVITFRLAKSAKDAIFGQS
jgi:DNA-binding protein HU-beta